MSDNNDKWLDEIISKIINTVKPQFDAEKWKQKYPDEFKMLQARNGKPSVHQFQWTTIFKNPISKLAAAAIIILAFGLLILQSNKKEKIETVKVLNVTQTSTEMLTLKSLTIAYRNGGIEAVEKQCDEAIEKLGFKPKKIAVQELISDIDGV
jgi:hypothetical protein